MMLYPYNNAIDHHQQSSLFQSPLSPFQNAPQCSWSVPAQIIFQKADFDSYITKFGFVLNL